MESKNHLQLVRYSRGIDMFECICIQVCVCVYTCRCVYGGACLCVYACVCVLGKTGRGAGDQWVKLGDGNWEIDGNSL